MSWAFDQGDEVIALRRERDSLRAQLAERDATIASLRNRIADNLCYLKPGEKLDPMLPKSIHLESCERFYDQEVGKRGVLEGCMTVAQLEEKLDKSEAEVRALLTKHAAEHSRAFVAEQKLAEAERKRDEYLVQREDMWTKQKCVQLAAQVERLRAVADDVVQGGGIADLEEARAVLAETPAQSLSTVRDQARRKTLEEAAREADSRAACMVELAIASSSNAIKCCRLADGKQWELRARWLRELAAQPAKEPQP